MHTRRCADYSLLQAMLMNMLRRLRWYCLFTISHVHGVTVGYSEAQKCGINFHKILEMYIVQQFKFTSPYPWSNKEQGRSLAAAGRQENNNLKVLMNGKQMHFGHSYRSICMEQSGRLIDTWPTTIFKRVQIKLAPSGPAIKRTWTEQDCVKFDS